MKKSSKAVQKVQTKRSELPTQIFGVLLIALALLMAVSLISHSPEDPPNSSRPPELAENLAGWIGAHLSYYLLFGVGYGAFVLNALVLFWGWNRFRLLPVQALVKHSLTLLILMVLYCGATGVPSRGRTYLAWQLGGWVGVTLSSAFLVPYLGRIGSYIFLSTVLVVMLMVVTEIPFSKIPDLACHAGQKVWAFVYRMGVGFGQECLRFKTWVLNSWKNWRKKRLLVQKKRNQPEADLMWAEEETEEIEAFDEPIPIEAFEAQLAEEAMLEPEIGPEREPEPPIVAPIVEAQVVREKGKDKKKSQSDINYTLPDLDLLVDPPEDDGTLDREYLLEGAQILEHSLNSFNVKGKVVQVNPGPVITSYEVEPAPGVKVNKIVGLADDLALMMRARSIRIQAPIPGKAAVGIEVPNPEPATVFLKEILESPGFQKSDAKLLLGLGKTATGEPVVADLAKMPHLLIAGATGAGKSGCINALICSLLFRNAPDEVRFLMVDPKMLELSIYNHIPHLLVPTVTEPKMASEALKWAVSEMENRYRTLAKYSVRNILDFNKKLERLRGDAPTEEDRADIPEHLPYIVVVIDELADLMMTAPADIEDSLARLAQMARAVGIHLVLATQRPSVNVITGVIKANFPTRIAFRVASKVDSRTIIDCNGAEKLLGRGDMLFLPPGKSEPTRVHGAWIDTDETEQIVQWVRGQGVELDSIELGGGDPRLTLGEPERDDRFDEALRLVVSYQQGSASLLQRRMKVGYSRAARLVDELEAAGIVGPSDGSSKGRAVLVGEEYLEQLEVAEEV
ncbi:MAG: DNA translocase FtsK 4TM domain-containing protein [bacterium]|nr:DNA translocase FtsK 4TM domain-containing protein [bacterium]